MRKTLNFCYFRFSNFLFSKLCFHLFSFTYNMLIKVKEVLILKPSDALLFAYKCSWNAFIIQNNFSLKKISTSFSSFNLIFLQHCVFFWFHTKANAIWTRSLRKGAFGNYFNYVTCKISFSLNIWKEVIWWLNILKTVMHKYFCFKILHYGTGKHLRGQWISK